MAHGPVWLLLTEREERKVWLARVDAETNEVAATVPIELGRGVSYIDGWLLPMGRSGSWRSGRARAVTRVPAR
jgi:hypothetical protein